MHVPYLTPKLIALLCGVHVTPIQAELEVNYYDTRYFDRPDGSAESFHPDARTSLLVGVYHGKHISFFYKMMKCVERGRFLPGYFARNWISVGTCESNRLPTWFTEDQKERMTLLNSIWGAFVTWNIISLKWIYIVSTVIRRHARLVHRQHQLTCHRNRPKQKWC